ncbi:MAG: DUF4038 domain-containing protein, partial [Firmicutes bacterium]|nr:DUF4038 domain-containing protein [Bacillota bacterium]
MYYAVQNCVAEIPFHSGKVYDDPFNEVDLDVIFEGPNGSKQVVPAFWAGENVWKVRFSTPVIGKYSYTTVCSDKKNVTFHDQKGEVQVNPYQGTNPLLRHGPLRVSENRRYLEHIDGTPFFWLGEIWIFGLSKRLAWPQDFRILTEDRVKKGFSVITLTAGLYPIAPPFLEERYGNEAGLPWEKNYTRINPAYFDMADLRIEYLIDAGLMPMIYGSWGFVISAMGVDKMKKQWRYLIARYGAYPVVWCLAGEVLLPFVTPGEPHPSEKEREIRKKEWTEVAPYIKQIDPYHRLLTAHPEGMAHSRSQVEDPESLIDFDYLQTIHSNWFAIPSHVKMVVEAVNRKPKMPVMVGEAFYEGHAGTMWEDVQRFIFWSSILSGTCGHTYGCEGIFQTQPVGEEPFDDGRGRCTYGTRSWKETYQYAGSKQMGIAKRLLERYRWWRLEPHPEWVKRFNIDTIHGWQYPKEYNTCYAAGIPGELRIIYF